MYNPVEVKINMKKIQNGDNVYYIGNSDMEINILDTVIKFYPAKEGERHGALILNNVKVKEKMDREDTSGGGDDDEG